MPQLLLHCYSCGYVHAQLRPCSRARVKQPRLKCSDTACRACHQTTKVRRTVRRITERAEWQRLYEVEGLSTYEIADRYDCEQRVVYDELKRRGVRLRSVSEALLRKAANRRKA